MVIYIFYDSSSKMYLIYSTLCYIITFSPATGYVLLAANIEDFRTLAKRLIPEHLGHLADDIFDIAKEVVIKESVRQNSVGFRHKSRDTFTKGLNWEDSGETGTKTTRKKHHKHKTTESTTSITPHFELNIDELVEKVKQKLKNEFHLIPQRGESENNENSNENEDDTDKDKISKIARNIRDKGKNGIQAKTPNDQNLKQKERKPGNKRYVADVFVDNPPKYMLDYSKNRKPTPTTKEKDYPTYTEDSQTNNEATEGNDLFVEVDLGNWNDSDDEKATPKKNNGYNEDIETAQKRVNKKSKIKQALVVHSDKELNIFSDEAATKYKNVGYDDETESYHRNKAIRNNKVTDPDENETFSPYSKQISKETTIYDNEKGITENNLALSHIILLDGDDEENLTHERVTPKMRPNSNNFKNKKNVRRPIKNTVIPKRDFYKISSPNFLLKVPIIGERYRFDEPIPEEDRDEEDLKYIGNPPASINGKIVLTN